MSATSMSREEQFINIVALHLVVKTPLMVRCILIRKYIYPQGRVGCCGERSQSGGLAFWLFLHGIFSTLFIALLILAVRRRFKVG